MKPYIVGIAGGSASGKSTFARALHDRLAGLEVSMLAMDTYFKAEKPLHTAPLTGRQWPDYNQPDSFHIHAMLRDMDSASGDVMLVEGLMVLRVDEVRERCDLRLFIDAPADQRICRRLKRNMVERGLSFDEIADYYVESVRFRHDEHVETSRWFADVVINGAQLSDAAVEMVAEYVGLQVRKTR